jgi:CHAT domain-containing protein
MKPLDQIIDPLLERVLAHGPPQDLEGMVNVARWLADAADAVCDIRDGLADQDDEGEWRYWTEKSATQRRDLIEQALIATMRSTQTTARTFGLMQRLKSPALVRRLRAHTRRRPDLSPAALAYDACLAARDAARARWHAGLRDGVDADPLWATLAEAEDALQAAEMRLRNEDPPALAALAAPLRPDDLLPLLPPDRHGAILDFYVTEPGLLVMLILREPGGVHIEGSLFPGLPGPMIREMGQLWLDARVQGPEELGGMLLDLLQLMGERLGSNLGPALFRTNAGQVTLIPHGVLHAFPLHLTPLHLPGKLLVDVCAMTYAPCVQLALSTALRPRPASYVRGQSKLLAVTDPRRNLPASRYEGERLRGEIGAYGGVPMAYEEIRGSGATESRIRSAVHDADVVLLSAHAHFDPQDPGASGLVAADQTWSVDDIYGGLHFQRHPVIMINACESGMMSLDERREVVALPYAFVTAGASAVLASLWPVEDISAGYFAERFFHHLTDPGEFPASAAGLAVQDLRQLMREGAAARVEALVARLEEEGDVFGEDADTYIRLTALRQQLEAGDEYPYAHPRFWGGYLVVGSGWRTVSGKGMTGKSVEPVDHLEAIVKLEGAKEAVRKEEWQEARRLAEEALPHLDDRYTGDALHILGVCADPFMGGSDGDLQENAALALDYYRRAREILVAQAETDKDAELIAWTDERLRALAPLARHR